jgi:plasmid stability protein
MATLTLKDVPDKLHSALKKRADRHRRSLNQEILYCLESLTGLAQPATDERQAWLHASEQTLRKAWAHPQDAVYDQMLKKCSAAPFQPLKGPRP